MKSLPIRIVAYPQSIIEFPLAGCIFKAKVRGCNDLICLAENETIDFDDYEKVVFLGLIANKEETKIPSSFYTTTKSGIQWKGEYLSLCPPLERNKLHRVILQHDDIIKGARFAGVINLPKPVKTVKEANLCCLTYILNNEGKAWLKCNYDGTPYKVNNEFVICLKEPR